MWLITLGLNKYRYSPTQFSLSKYHEASKSLAKHDMETESFKNTIEEA